MTSFITKTNEQMCGLLISVDPMFPEAPPNQNVTVKTSTREKIAQLIFILEEHAQNLSRYHPHLFLNSTITGEDLLFFRQHLCDELSKRDELNEVYEDYTNCKNQEYDQNPRYEQWTWKMLPKWSPSQFPIYTKHFFPDRCINFIPDASCFSKRGEEEGKPHFLLYVTANYLLNDNVYFYWHDEVSKSVRNIPVINFRQIQFLNAMTRIINEVNSAEIFVRITDEYRTVCWDKKIAYVDRNGWESRWHQPNEIWQSTWIQTYKYETLKTRFSIPSAVA